MKWVSRPEALISLHANNSSLISVIVSHSLERIISKFATCKFSIFQPIFVAEQTDLRLIRSKAQQTGFLATWPY